MYASTLLSTNRPLRPGFPRRPFITQFFLCEDSSLPHTRPTVAWIFFSKRSTNFPVSLDEALRVGKRLTESADRFRPGEGGDEVRIAAFQVPEVMQVAVRQHDEPAIQGARIATRLLLADQRLFALRLCFQHHQREAPVVQQQKIDCPPFGSLKVVPQSVKVGRPDGDAVLQTDGPARLRRERNAIRPSSAGR